MKKVKIVLAVLVLFALSGCIFNGNGESTNPFGIPDSLLKLVMGAAQGVNVGSGFISPTASKPEMHEGAMMLAQVAIALSPELTAFANSAVGQQMAQEWGCEWRCPVMKAIVLSGGGVIHYYDPPGQTIDPNGPDRYMRMFWTTWQEQEFGKPEEVVALMEGVPFYAISCSPLSISTIPFEIDMMQLEQLACQEPITNNDMVFLLYLTAKGLRWRDQENQATADDTLLIPIRKWFTEQEKILQDAA